MSRWIIVSNRLPVAFDAETNKLRQSSGGLVTAITGIRSKDKKVWVGCAPPELTRSKWDRLTKDSPKNSMELRPLFVDENLYESYYNNFSNDVLWPLLHYEIERVRYSEDAWDAYEEVNHLFAEEVLKVCKPGDMIWVHDFHLFLLPKILKQARPNLKVGFFLHVPFPSSEIYRQLPAREIILDSLLYSDLVGFHDYSYLRHFGSALLNTLGVESDLLSARYKGRRVRLGVFPVSIDTQKFSETAKGKKVAQWQKESSLSLFTYLGVDRLDYTKGLNLKLQAYERLLELNPELCGQVRLLQIAVPSRTDVPEYQELRQEIEGLVGHINGRFGTPKWTPIRYVFGSVNFEYLLALYREADALMVSSKRDGMNLVALEFISAQDPKNPGIALLSEFAGASSMLSGTMNMNPWDVERSAQQMKTAFDMTLEERLARWQPMADFLHDYTGTTWAESFINRLREVQHQSHRHGLHFDLKNGGVKKLKRQLRQTKPQKFCLLLDYDGSLVPLAQRPEEAVLPPSGRNKIKAWMKSGKAQIAVVSGRPKKFLETQLKDTGVIMASEHGAQVFMPSEGRWRKRVNSPKERWYPLALRIMNDYTRRVQNSFVEQKTYSIAWHYRLSPPEFGYYQAKKLFEELEIGLGNMPVNVLAGKKVIEVRAIEANKGSFVNDLLNHMDPEIIPIVIGDDQTDEDMFEVVKDRGIAFKVGDEPTAAKYFIEDQSQVFELIESFLKD